MTSPRPPKRSHDLIEQPANDSPSSSPSSSTRALEATPSRRRPLPAAVHDHRLGAINAVRLRRRMMDAALHDFPYCEKLRAHHSCVNALAFSKGEGRYLASSGDDRTVLVWDLHSDGEEERRPCASFRGHRSNVFTVAFNASNTHLYSGGNDAIVMRYDLSRLPTAQEREVHSRKQELSPSPPSDVFLDHSAAVHSVAPHPYNDHTFLSASEDGTIRLEDCRARPTRKGLIINNASFTDVKWHPNDGNLFISTDQRGRVTLHDARTAFKSTPTKRADVIVTDYLSRISLSLGNGMESLCRPESSSISFDSTGTLFAVEFLMYCPVIYSLADPVPVLTLDGITLPNGKEIPAGQRFYTNRCTTKHGSFGGERDGSLYYGTGSDDFRAWCWKIPPLQSLLSRRDELTSDAWQAKTSVGIGLAFSESKAGKKYVPVRINTPSYRLEGHRSIVNTVVYHPVLPLVFTSGVEKVIRSFSHFPQRPLQKRIDPSDTRELSTTLSNSRVLLAALAGEIGTQPGQGPPGERAWLQDAEEDGDAIALFDSLLQEEETTFRNSDDNFDMLRRHAREEDEDDSSDFELSDMDIV